MRERERGAVFADVAAVFDATTLDDVYQWGANQLTSQTPAAIAKVAVAEDGMLIPRAGTNGGTFGQEHAIPIATTVPGSVYTTGMPCIVPDLHDTRSVAASTTACDPLEYRSLICAKLGSAGVLVGLAREVDAFDEQDRAIATRIARMVDVARAWYLAANAPQASADHLLEDIGSIVSHDLQNKLAVLTGRLELAKTTGDVSHLDACARAVDGIASIADMVTTLAKTGDPIDELEPIRLGAFAEATFTSLPTADATLEVEAEPTILADQNCLGQLLENLFRNAIEHGSPDVTLTVGSVSDGFFVADDGPGIDPHLRDDVWSLGFSTEPDHDGRGLAIVRHMALAHGWSIEITESDSGGARIEIHGVDRVGTASE